MEYTLDATNKPLGRLASEVAVYLRGKDTPTFERHLKPKNKVRVINAGHITVSGSKREDKVYLRHSGYPGGQKGRTLNELATKKGMSEALKIAVRGMLPDNKLRSIMMNNLTITE
ncbi:MAG: 50S ribosomal protein L13 [Patescibacteria group bacterium]